jgi:hypothetical protein
VPNLVLDFTQAIDFAIIINPKVGARHGALLCALAVIAVALEARGPTIALGGIAAWMITYST